MSTTESKAGYQPGSTKSECPSLPLILDLIGPVVVHFCHDEKGNNIARIHLPLCIGHHANVLTDSNDISLVGLQATDPPMEHSDGYVYAFFNSSSPAPAANRAYFNPEQVLIAPYKMQQIHEKECHLVLQVPSPDKVVGLHPELIWMHRNDADMWVNEDGYNIVYSQRARGLRFIYSQCQNPPTFVAIKHPAPPSDDPSEFGNDFCAVALGSTPAPHYYITVRFASSSATDTSDEHHEDAYNCFQSMRNTVKTTEIAASGRAVRADAVRWRVDFDDLVVPEPDGSKPDIRKPIIFNLSGRHPVDCGAAVLIVDNTVPGDFEKKS